MIDKIRKYIAIELLSNKIADLEKRNEDLLVCNNAQLARARAAEDKLRTIKARINGEWDNPGLVALGPLGTTLYDIQRIIDK